MRTFSRIMYTFLLFFGLAFLLHPNVLHMVSGAVTNVTEQPTIILPKEERQENVPIITFFKWQKVPNATVYAYILRPQGGNAPPQFTGGVSGAPAGEVWVQPSLIPAQWYDLSVQGCEKQDISSCGPAKTVTFRTQTVTVAPPSGSGGGGGTTPIINPGDLNPIINPGDLNPIRCRDLVCFFNAVFSFLFGLAIFIVPVIVIYAAFLMLMGGGDPEKLAKGRMILLWTAIAFIIILLSRGLPVVFKNLL